MRHVSMFTQRLEENMNKIICLKDEPDSDTRYISVPVELSRAEIVRRLAEALGPDNEPYGLQYYDDRDARFWRAVHACGWTEAPVETIVLSELMEGWAQSNSCGAPRASMDQQASLLRLVAHLEKV